MPDAEAELGVIAANAHGDVITCCDSLFKLWLQRQSEASWGQLIQGLKDIELGALAVQIEKKLEPSIHTTTTTTIVSQMPKSIAHIASDMPVLYVTDLQKGLIHSSNSSTSRICNSGSIGSTALKFGSRTFLSMY